MVDYSDYESSPSARGGGGYMQRKNFYHAGQNGDLKSMVIRRPFRDQVKTSAHNGTRTRT